MSVFVIIEVKLVLIFIFLVMIIVTGVIESRTGHSHYQCQVTVHWFILVNQDHIPLQLKVYQADIN